MGPRRPAPLAASDFGVKKAQINLPDQTGDDKAGANSSDTERERNAYSVYNENQVEDQQNLRSGAKY